MAYDPNQHGKEANGNIQYTSAIVFPTPVTFYSTGGEMETEFNDKPAPGDGYTLSGLTTYSSSPTPIFRKRSTSRTSSRFPEDCEDHMPSVFRALSRCPLRRWQQWRWNRKSTVQCLLPRFLYAWPFISPFNQHTNACTSHYRGFHVLQVPMSLALVARPNMIPKSGRASPRQLLTPL